MTALDRIRLKIIVALVAIAIGIPSFPTAASAQQSSTAEVMLDEIVTTARRKDEAEELQTVPVAVSAFNGDQLDAMQFANLEDVTSAVPNAHAERKNGRDPGRLRCL